MLNTSAFASEDRGPKVRPRRVLLITAALSGFVLALGLTPVLAPPEGLDRIAHVIAFAGLVLPAAMLGPGLLWALVPALAVFGGLVEACQPLFGRDASLSDLMSNLSGLLLGSAIGLSLRALLASAPSLAQRPQ